MNKKFVLIMALMIVLMGMFGAAFGVQKIEAAGPIIYVDGSNFGDPLEDGSQAHPFNSIQEGVDAVSPGGTVQIAPWTYYENVLVDKRLTLLGEDRTKTVIDGSGGDVVRLAADNVSVRGFTIQNGMRGILIDSSGDCTISGNTLIHNEDHGIYVWHSNNNTVTSNTMAFNNWTGIFLSSSHNNIVIRNTISNNVDGFGFYESNNSRIYRNNIMDNTRFQASVDPGSLNTVWEGNYWSDYGGEDLNGDGIGDTPYTVNMGNEDDYPRVNPWPQVFEAVWESTPYNIAIVSNSTVTAFLFSQPDKQISFDVTRPSGTTGLCNVTILHTLLGGPYSITVDDLPVAPSPIEVSNSAHTFIYFTYNHSTRIVKIKGTTVISEFSTWTSMLLILITLTVSIAICKRRLLKTPIQ